MKIKKQLLDLTAYVPGKSAEQVKRQYQLEKIVKMASNENPYGCSPAVLSAISNPETAFSVYPDGSAQKLRALVAADVGVDLDQLIFSSGLDELIQIISRALLSPEVNVIMAKGTFPQYRHHAVIENAEIREVPLKDGVHDLEGMAAKIDGRTNLIWICNPNNPTGTYIPEKELIRFLELVPEDVLVVLDEAYYEYACAKDYPQSLPLLSKYPNILIMRTFSKAYGISAFRIGYGIGHASFIKDIEVARLPFNTSAPAQAAACAALEDKEFMRHAVESNEQELKKYYRFCEEEDIGFYPSEGNFIFIRFTDRSSTDVAQYLMERGWIVRPFPDGIRVTIGTPEENDGLLAVLKEMMLVKI